METCDCIVIGAGVIGLAVAREMAIRGRETLLIEAADAIGTETSSRNSEVIHAGLYYSTGSLKARTCVSGRDALYRYCDDRGVPFKKLGKMLIATDEAQLPKLAAIADQARRNGVNDLMPLTQSEARKMEPALTCAAAIFSPSTGIIDTHALMLAYQGDAEAAGALAVFSTPVTGGRIDQDRIVLQTGGLEPYEIAARSVINAAGLDAPDLARQLLGLAPKHVPIAYYAKGNYFSLSGVRTPFRHLVYPMPDHAGLGVHLTLDLAMRARFGPDVEWIRDRLYEVDPSRAAGFYDAIRRYWPELPDGSLVPDYAGIRPKISGPNAPAADFQIQGRTAHGIAGLVNLFGIESPGITASLALATLAADAVLDRG